MNKTNFIYSRLNYLSNNMKRVKDNSGYSFGTAIASLSPVSSNKSPNYSKTSRCLCNDQVIVTREHNMHVLRTTAINSDTVDSVMETVSWFSLQFLLVTSVAETFTRVFTNNNKITQDINGSALWWRVIRCLIMMKRKDSPYSSTMEKGKL